ncbi:MAG: alpha-maltose-phosphate synthase [Candidatus Woesearchaeota archaeon]|nr:alpha-maltose-phosphate synthase [Candidatus Woesearchaeota archaeon]
MKILIITAFVEGAGGGTGRVAYDMAKAFSNEHEVALVCPNEKTGIIRKEGNLTIYGIKSVTVQKNKDLSFSWWSPKEKKEFYNFIEEFSPDVIHSHQPINIDTVALKYATKHSIPFFYTGHILPSQALVFFLPGKIAKPINNLLSKSILKSYFKAYLDYCDGIVALNKSSYEDHKNIISSQKLHIIQNGKDLRKFYKGNFPKIEEKKKKLLFVGYLSKRKNQEFLIDVMKYLPEDEFELNLVGPTLSSQYLKNVKEKIEESKLKNINIIGAVNYEKIPEYYKESHIFVSAATLEVQSLVIIEALSSGTPVVGLSNETIDDVIKNGKNGYKLPKDASPKEFAERIMKIASLDQQNYEKMCKNAYESSKVFDWDNVIEKTIQMYQEAKKEHLEKKRRELLRLNAIEGANEAFYSSAYLVAASFVLFKKALTKQRIKFRRRHQLT